MSDLISRQDAIDAIEGETTEVWTESDADFNRGMEMAKSIVESFPSADAVEVVRCKDCKHWYADADTGMACEFTNMGQPADGYCNWGERKGGDSE